MSPNEEEEKEHSDDEEEGDDDLRVVIGRGVEKKPATGNARRIRRGSFILDLYNNKQCLL